MPVLLPDPVLLPLRPWMPTSLDEKRSRMQQTQLQILIEEHDQIVSDWLAAHISPERRALWGPPDTSSNAVLSICRQLSTPGLYGRRPLIGHPSPMAQPLIAPGGLLDKAHYAPRMQYNQRLTLGLGDYFIRPAFVNGSLVLRPVAPHNVYTQAHPDAPDVPLVLWELRIRYWVAGAGQGKGRWMYTWDKYDISDLKNPSFVIELASGHEDLGLNGDATNLFLNVPPDKPLRGRRYPWRDESGKPYIPYACYRAVDSGEPWNHRDKRGAFRGTLNGILYNTYAGHCARDATGSTVFIGGMVPLSGGVQNAGQADNVTTVQLSPGAAFYHQVMEGVQPFVKEVGPGANLTEVAAFARDYRIDLATAFGLNPADISRQHANPTSGAALTISNRVKREHSEMCMELFRPADLSLFKIIAGEARVMGLGHLPETGYGITYQQIEKGPEEKQEERDDLDWKVQRGHISEVGAWMAQHPGSSRELAIQALTAARIEQALLDESIRRALAAKGLLPPPPSPAPVLPPPAAPGAPAPSQPPAAPASRPGGSGSGSGLEGVSKPGPTPPPAPPAAPVLVKAALLLMVEGDARVVWNRVRTDIEAAIGRPLREPGPAHITVLMVGEVDERAALPEVLRIARDLAADAEPLSVTLGGIGFFGDKEGDTPVYLDVDAPGLLELNARLLRRLAPYITAPQFDPFHAHLTLGYAEQLTEAERNQVAAIKVAATRFSIADLVLSIRKYETLARLPLGSTTPQ